MSKPILTEAARAYLSEIASRGGSVKSPAKRRKALENLAKANAAKARKAKK